MSVLHSLAQNDLRVFIYFSPPLEHYLKSF
nr:MAG TPA: hypothetical protein [Caudoviricetes sp.]